MTLEKELETFKSKLSEWPEREGKYVLIHGELVIDFFDSYDDALKAGYAQFSLQPFLVKQIQLIEQVHFISRLVQPIGTAN